MLCSMKPWFVWDNPAILYILIIFFILTRLPFARTIAYMQLMTLTTMKTEK